MVKIYNFSFLFLCLLGITSHAQKVSNVNLRQEQSTIVISYDLETKTPCKISLFVSIDDGITWQGPLKKVTGDAGTKIDTGNHSITWNVLEEFEELRGDKIKFQVKASRDYIQTVVIDEIKIKEKDLNLTIFEDVSITNLKTRGPSSALYSVIMPGWGTRHVTYNQEGGWGKFWRVVIPLTLSLVSESISKSNYTKYKESNTKQLSEDYYNKANLFHQGSIVMASVSFGFYVAEIISVIKKGNRKIYK